MFRSKKKPTSNIILLQITLLLLQKTQKNKQTKNSPKNPHKNLHIFR